MRMRRSARTLGLWLGALLALQASGAIASAAPKQISGKLSKPGYTVIALAADGEASTDPAPRGGFKLRPPADLVSLHIRAPDGAYAGPIVVRARAKRDAAKPYRARAAGRRALVGVRAGAKLREVKVRGGYARVAMGLAAGALDAERKARAKRGVPIGAGVFGRVLSPPPPRPTPGDLDLDGVPDPLDIDDDGDLVLDNLESPATARGSFGVRTSQAGADLGLGTVITSPNPTLIVNANPRHAANPGAPAFTDDEIEKALAEQGDLLVGIVEGGEAELDCRGLVYCSQVPGATGHAFFGDTGGLPFPGEPGGAFDPDGDGFGTLTAQLGSAPGTFHLGHGARTDQIRTGDVLIERVTTPTGEQEFPGTMPEVLATVSALVSYDDGATNRATLSYPIEAPPGPGNAPPIAEGSDEKLDLTVTLWRPQRRPTPSEPGYGTPGAWTDIGGLSYQTTLGGLDWGVGRNMACPQSSLSTTDPGLAPASLPGTVDQAGGFTDLAPDRPANPGNTLTYSINITQCIADLNAELQRQGSSESISWPQGEDRPLGFKARDHGNRVQACCSGYWFERQ